MESTGLREVTWGIILGTNLSFIFCFHGFGREKRKIMRPKNKKKEGISVNKIGTQDHHMEETEEEKDTIIVNGYTVSVNMMQTQKANAS